MLKMIAQAKQRKAKSNNGRADVKQLFMMATIIAQAREQADTQGQRKQKRTMWDK